MAGTSALAADPTAELLLALESAISRYNQVVRRTIEESGDAESLTVPQYRCLQVIAARGVTLITRLARELRVTVPTMTSRLDGLVERGLVQRQPDPASRRQIRVSLTPAGALVLERYRALIDGALRALLAPLTLAAWERRYRAMNELAALLDPAGHGSPAGAARAGSG